MIGHVRAVTPEQLRSLQENPSSVRGFLHGEQIANSAKAKAALLRIQQMARERMAAGQPKNDERFREHILAELESAGVTPLRNPDAGLSLEKSWHSLHYLLTGTARETDSLVGKAILGGIEMGPDVGYGPARYLDATEVEKVANSLKAVSEDDLALRFDLKAMKTANIYACCDEDELGLAQGYFVQLCDYYEKAAARGDAMLLYID